MDAIKNSNFGGSDGQRTNWMRFGAGRTKIRILPPWSAAGQIAKEVHTHSIEYHAENINRWRFTCPKKSHTADSCPICDHLALLKNQGIPTDKFDKMGREYWCNALVVDDPNYDGAQRGYAPGTVVVLCLPKTVLNSVYEQMMNPLVGNVTDLELGVDFIVSKTGQGLNTRYTTQVVGRRDIREEVKNKELYDLDSLFNSAGTDEVLTGLKVFITQECRAAQSGIVMPNLTAPAYVPPMAVVQQQAVVRQPATVSQPQVAAQPATVAQPQVAPMPSTQANPFTMPGVTVDQPQVSASDGIVRPEGCPGTYAPDQVVCLVCANAGRCAGQ